MFPEVLLCRSRLDVADFLCDLAEQGLFSLDLFERREGLCPFPEELLLKGMKEHPGDLGVAAKIDIFGVRMQDEFQVVRNIDPVSIQGGDQFHETVEKTENGGSA